MRWYLESYSLTRSSTRQSPRNGGCLDITWLPRPNIETDYEIMVLLFEALFENVPHPELDLSAVSVNQNISVKTTIASYRNIKVEVKWDRYVLD